MPEEFKDPLVSPKRRLNSWKEIANHFGKDLSPRTAQRWEAEGLPIYREGVKVFAYADELDTWQKNRIVGPPSPQGLATRQKRRSLHLIVIKLGALLVVAVVIAGIFWAVRGPYQVPANKETRPRRLFARATSEGHSPRRLDTGQKYPILLMAPDGKELYALSHPEERFLSVIGVEDLQVKRTIRLPHPPRTAFVPRDGKHIYISSFEDGIMVVDPRTDRGVERVISTSTPAFDVAVTPDEKKLFLAMGNEGLQRIDLQTGESRVLSPLACPVYLKINLSGRRLYVSYQCQGPGGRKGHDAVAIYDVDSERSLEVINGLAMVGGHLDFAPQEEDVVLLNGMDACSSPDYDHVGCSKVPGQPYYWWRASDRSLIATISFSDLDKQEVLFRKGTRVVFSGSDLQIWDWARQMALETVSLPGVSLQPAAVTPTGDRLFAALDETAGLLVFDAEKEECLPPIHGLVNFYAGDGTRDDSQGSAALVIAGHPKFEPGLMGQAFSLDGDGSFLSARTGAAFCNFCDISWSVSFFIKFHSTAGEITILERETTDPAWDLRLFKTKDNRVVLASRSKAASKFSVAGRVHIDAGKWYHMAVVNRKDHRSLFIDGASQGEQHLTGTIDSPGNSVDRRFIFFGATQGKRDYLSGLIDELAVYDRPLEPGEVMKISNACGAKK